MRFALAQYKLLTFEPLTLYKKLTFAIARIGV
jgi:hypothetical protein